MYGHDAVGRPPATTPARPSRRGAVVSLAEALDGERRRLIAAPGAAVSAGPSTDGDAPGAATGEVACAAGQEAAGPTAARPGHRRRRPGEGDEDRRVILAYIEDFARELGDQATLASSTTRAYNVYRRAGVDQEVFVAALLEARAVTKEHGATNRAHADRDGWLAPTPKMAYFFAVLEDVLGLKDE